MGIYGVIKLNMVNVNDKDNRVLLFYKHIMNHLLNILKIQLDINQQDFKIGNLHFVKSE